MKNLKEKKLLILAGAGVHTKVVKTAKEMGIYTIVTDYLTDSPAKMIADESWMYSITDVDEIVERCKQEGVDGVINYCIDPAQLPYREICERLNLPCTGTKEQFDVLTDKIRFKDYCIAHNVDVIPEYSYEDILNDKAEYPLFIKPNDSRGSRGQTVCDTKEEAIRAIELAKSESSTDSFICEKYMRGYQDVGSAFYVVDGEPYLVKFGDRHLGREEDHLEKQVMCTQLPSSFSPTFAEKVMPRVKEMIKALGIKFGPVFLQGFIDGDTIRYYDPALRMPGGDYDLVLKKATGFDSVKSLIHFALTGDTKTCFGNPEDSYLLNNGESLLVTLTVHPGKMVKVSGLETIAQCPDVVYTRQIISEGTVIPDSGDIKQRVAAVGTYVKDKKKSAELLNYIYSTYRVLDENGNNMVVSKYQYE